MRLEPAAQHNVTAQLKKISSAVQVLPDAIILLNNDDGLEWWNQAAEDLLLLQARSKGQSIFEFVPVAPEFREYYHLIPIPNDGVHIESWRDA